MLGKFPWYSRHVSRLPCEDIFVIAEELDERAFLCQRKIGTDGGGLGGLSFHKFHRLGIVCSLEGGGRLGDLLLGSWHLRGLSLLLEFLQFLSV